MRTQAPPLVAPFAFSRSNVPPSTAEDAAAAGPGYLMLCQVYVGQPHTCELNSEEVGWQGPGGRGQGIYGLAVTLDSEKVKGLEVGGEGHGQGVGCLRGIQADPAPSCALNPKP